MRFVTPICVLKRFTKMSMANRIKRLKPLVFVFLSTALLSCIGIVARGEAPKQSHNFGIVCNPYLKDWENPEKTVTLLKELGVKLVICKLSWKDIEKEKGKFSEEGWKVYDEIVNKLTSCGIDVMCLVAATPPWAIDPASNPGNWKGKRFNPPSKNPKDLGEFVTVAAKRYKNKIKRWAMFNATQGKKHWIKPEQLAELYKAGSQAIKSEIPDSVIVMPGLEETVDKRGPYLEKFLQTGGGKYVDMYDFHMNLGGGAHFSAVASETNALKDILKKYDQLGKPIQYGAIATPNRFVSKEKTIKKLMAKGWKPIDFERITPELQAIRLVTLMVWGRSLGMDKIFWTRTREYAPESGPEYEKWLSEMKKIKPAMKEEREYNRTMGIINYNYEPKPSFHAFKTLIEKLDTATFLRELNVGENAKAFIFQKEGKHIGIFWTWEGKMSLTLGIDVKNVTLSDLYGKIITPVDINNGKLTLHLTPSVIYVEGGFKEITAS